MQSAPTTNPCRLIALALLALCGGLNLVVLTWILFRHPFLNADFLGFWAYPRFAPLPALYQPDAMMHFQQALYPGYKSFYPYTYPPDFLVVTGWLRDFGFSAARDVWLLAGVLVFAAVGLGLFRAHPWAVVVLLASPAALLSIILGQTSFFFGALLLGGLAALPKRPLLAGVLFGLLTLKPQMGLLLPFLLLARGEGRAILAASLTAAALVALSCALLPPDLWLLWLHGLPQIQRDYFAGGANLNIMITPAANLVRLGAPANLAMGVQALCAMGAAFLVWRAGCGPYNQAMAILLVASFLAQPHAYAYDTVTLPAALILAGPGPWWRAGLAGLLYLAPLALLTHLAGFFLYSPLLAAFLAALAA